MRADSAVEPTKSENITVTWRRSASDLAEVVLGGGRSGRASSRQDYQSSAIARSSRRRWPSDATPIFSRS